MAIEFMDVMRDIGSIATLVLIPIWKGISGVKDELTKTNLTLAKDYMTKADCDKKHADCNNAITRIHDRIDERSWK
ncbi:MAG: hypothetical protein AB7D38_12215 [Sulfurimonas sp.]|uniref:hypothetical protein n=1 Tax=Sulfurimonas sp. TaxID=2022749 RepID=UPI003D128425